MPDYEADFYGWANEQAALLRAGRLGEADVANIAEEIESMGRSEKRELVNRLSILLAHLLKWRYQPDRKGRSWELTIDDHRDRISALMADNPSLRSRLEEAMAQAYRQALRQAEAETRMPRADFPAVTPWTVEQVLDEAFFPQ